LLVAAFVPAPYGIAAPASVMHFVIFLITLILGLLVTIAFCMLAYGLTFFTISPQGLRMVFVSMVEFFAGAVIPIPFFPEKMQKVLELLPFASMQNVALRIYSGSMTGAQMQKNILIQIFWLVALVLMGSSLCRFAEKKVTVQGG
jgi:ABC-2 type transport system permease protein